MTESPEQATSLGRTVGLAVAAAGVICLLLLAFAWPSVTSDPHDIPVGIVATDEQLAQVGGQVNDQTGGVIALERYADRDAAIAGIQAREVYGALVLADPSAGAPSEMLTATAANAVIAQMLQGIAGQVQAQVTDVVPLSSDDPRGAGLAAAALPLVMGGMVGAILISTAVQGVGRRFVALVAYAVVAGLALAAILGGWFGALQGSYALNALAIMLAISAISATIIGLHSLLGYAGIALGAALMFLFANPISGAALPPEFLVGSWGAIGQWFPPGAGQTLIRTLSYFPYASTTFPWMVLVGWTLLGVVLLGVGGLRTRGS